MITHTDNTIFAIILTAAVFTFGFSVARLVRAIRLGKPDLRLRESLMKRFVTMLGYAFGQKRVLDELFGLNHFFLFWGFMILFFYNTTFILNGLFPEFSLSLAGPFLYPILTLLFDLVPILVILCVIIALCRRACGKTCSHRLPECRCLYYPGPCPCSHDTLLRIPRFCNRPGKHENASINALHPGLCGPNYVCRFWKCFAHSRPGFLVASRPCFPGFFKLPALQQTPAYPHSHTQLFLPVIRTGADRTTRGLRTGA